MIRLAVATLRDRRSVFIGTFVASLLALSLITSCSILMESPIRGSQTDGESYTGAIAVFGTMGGISTFAAIFVIAGTVIFSVQLRLRELALLRTIGAVSAQLRRMIAVEMLMLFLASAVFAFPLGIGLAHLFGKSFRELGAIPETFTIVYGPLPFLIAAGAGLIVTQIAGWIASRKAARIPPVQALNETVHEPSRFGLVSFLLGVIFSAGAAAVLAFTPMKGGVGVGMSFIGCSLLLIATALLGPLLVRTVGRIVSGIAQLLGGVTGTMAAANIRSQSSNVASAFVPLTLLLALNGTMLLTSTLLNEQTAEQHQQRIAAADHVLSLQGESSRFSTELMKQVEQLQVAMSQKSWKLKVAVS